MEKEDGEMSDCEDDSAMLIDTEALPPNPQITSPDPDFALIYKADKTGLVVEKLGKTDASKLEERAARFGLNLTGSKLITQKQLDDLYANFGIASGNERHFRLDTLHIGGVDGLTTTEIFEYLEDYKPVSLEWIDDKSCNVICQDHISAALALLVHSREIRNDDIKEMLATVSKFHWREGMPHEKKEYIFLRFATNSDKKEPIRKHNERHRLRQRSIDESMDPISKNPWGDLCQSWGTYDHQEIINRRLDHHNNRRAEPIRPKSKSIALRLGKRTAKYAEDSDSDSSTEWKRSMKFPRMRMHADDEENRQKKKREAHFTKILPEKVTIKQEDEDFAPLSIEVANTGSSYTPKELTKLSDKFKKHIQNKATEKQDGIHSRLGAKVPISNIDMVSDHESSSSTSSDESEKSDHHVMSKVEKVKGDSKHARLLISIDNSTCNEETHESKKDRNDLRQRIKSGTPTNKFKDSSHKSKDLSYKSRDLSYKSRDFSYKSKDLSYKSKDLSNKSKDLSKKSKDLRQRLGKNELLRIEINNDDYRR